MKLNSLATRYLFQHCFKQTCKPGGLYQNQRSGLQSRLMSTGKFNPYNQPNLGRISQAMRRINSPSMRLALVTAGAVMTYSETMASEIARIPRTHNFHLALEKLVPYATHLRYGPVVNRAALAEMNTLLKNRDVREFLFYEDVDVLSSVADNPDLPDHTRQLASELYHQAPY